jgi:hypothetical protein
MRPSYAPAWCRCTCNQGSAMSPPSRRSAHGEEVAAGPAVELLIGIEGASSRPVRRIVLIAG